MLERLDLYETVKVFSEATVVAGAAILLGLGIAEYSNGEVPEQIQGHGEPYHELFNQHSNVESVEPEQHMCIPDSFNPPFEISRP